MVTEEKGLFGIPVTLQWFDGYLDSINALNAGQLDCNSQTLNDTISSIAGGADLQVVLTNDNSTGNDQIIAATRIAAARMALIAAWVRGDFSASAPKLADALASCA